MGRWVGGAHRIPAAGAEREPDHTTVRGGVDSPRRTGKCCRRTTRRLSSLSVLNALHEDVRLFVSAPISLKTAPALAYLVERFFYGAEAVLKNVWQNDFAC